MEYATFWVKKKKKARFAFPSRTETQIFCSTSEVYDKKQLTLGDMVKVARIFSIYCYSTNLLISH